MDDLTELVLFVMDKAEGEPLERRMKLYHGLAIVCGEEVQTQNLRKAALLLQEAEKFSRDLKNSFKQTYKQP